MRRILVTLILLALPLSSAQALTTEALMDTVQHAAFKFFWEQANPSNGLIKDRNTPGSVSSIASTGFGLSAITVGIDHGWITREEGRDRVLTTLNTFWTGPQGDAASGFIGYKGLYYHWLDMNTATRTWDSELSTIDTALLFAGILDCKQYFTEDDPTEEAIRSLADSIYYRADWFFMRAGTSGIRMGWKPVTGFSGFGHWIGYNEAMILYILAIGSPTYPVPYTDWYYWTSGYSWQTQFFQEYVIFPPLFGHQYSHCWIDFRNMPDEYMQIRGIDYFENSRRATLAQWAYCSMNPEGWADYSDSLFGITASDIKGGYAARGAPPEFNDDGTIAPTGAIGSLPFAPEVVIPVMHNLWNNYRSSLWGPYGFNDAFNPTLNWWDTDVIGIDQGPIVLMIENYRNQAVWRRFMQNPDILNGLTLAKFNVVVGIEDRPMADAGGHVLFQTRNPLNGSTVIQYRLGSAGHVKLGIYDVGGRRVAQLVDEYQGSGMHSVDLNPGGWASGVYFYSLEVGGQHLSKKFVLMN